MPERKTENEQRMNKYVFEVVLRRSKEQFIKC